MSPHTRPFLADEELGKKDDDHRPRRTRPDQQWQPRAWKPPRRRRVLLVPVILFLLYLFFKNMPTDLGPVSQRRISNPHPSQHLFSDALPPPGTSSPGPPPRDEPNAEDKGDLYYEGKLHFHELGKTLKLFRPPVGQDGNVASSTTVFAAASLESVSDLLPLACRMANQKLNKVHFILMGRDDVSVEGIQRVNGVDRVNCPLNWHGECFSGIFRGFPNTLSTTDARVDYAPWSTDARMERAIVTVLPYVQTYLRPRVIITQAESVEDQFFSKSIQTTRDLGIPHIALPRAARDLMWMATLDSNALQTWNDIHVEILIQAPSNSAGSLIRLLRSLGQADYLGFSPSLTIELPSRVDPGLLRFLKGLEWPLNQVNIRRRIQLQELSPYESSLRAVEAFYPKDPTLSHVLVLSPDVELAPSFYHYLMYTMLRYRYSTRPNILPSQLVGLSLELPPSDLTTEPSKRPDIDTTQFSSHNDPDALPLFLSQAPSSNAALYFGDNWAALHTFLGLRLTVEGSDAVPLQGEKVISEKYPAFMEFLLELIRARGFYLLYPAFYGEGNFALATFHSELFQDPEEFARDTSDAPRSEINLEESTSENPLSGDATLMPLLDTFSLELPSITRLPIFTYRGEEIPESEFFRDTKDYAENFRSKHGGCGKGSFDDDETRSDKLFCVN
ncbi:hypothetical protein BJX61DRAFT_392098 [Aspergillus egyptiacus]|nr:hypothetical protein BJX61DRAFT_392098 [Aspergillus egyptiacus]